MSGAATTADRTQRELRRRPRRRWIVVIVALAIATLAVVIVIRPWLWDDYMAGYRAGGTHVNPVFCTKLCSATDPPNAPAAATAYSRGLDDGWHDRFPRLWRTSLLRDWLSPAGAD